MTHALDPNSHRSANAAQALASTQAAVGSRLLRARSATGLSLRRLHAHHLHTLHILSELVHFGAALRHGARLLLVAHAMNAPTAA